jgi:hypothetical protein
LDKQLEEVLEQTLNLELKKVEFDKLLGPAGCLERFPNLDMELDWSKVDIMLREETVSEFWTIGTMYHVLECLKSMDRIVQKLTDTKTTLKGLCLFSNQTEISTYATKTREDKIGMDMDEYTGMIAGVKVASPGGTEEELIHGEPDGEDDCWVLPWCDQSLTDDKQLTKLATAWNQMIMDAKILGPLTRENTEKEKQVYQASMQETASYLLLWDDDQKEKRVVHFRTSLPEKRMPCNQFYTLSSVRYRGLRRTRTKEETTFAENAATSQALPAVVGLWTTSFAFSVASLLYYFRTS